MIRGIWISASAMEPMIRAQEILANNLANAGTSGFRQDRFAFHGANTPGLPTGPAGAAAEPAGAAPRLTGSSGNASGAAAAATGAASPSTAASSPTAARPGSAAQLGSAEAPVLTGKIDLESASFETTGDQFHLAIAGPGFFTVQGPEGELYSRDGTLQRATDGTILHHSGYPLMTEGGNLVVPKGSELTVGLDGTAFVDGSAVGKLRIAALDSQQLSHAGAGLVRSAQPAGTDTESRVLQGSIEGANVNGVLAMIEMMELQRGFEANQRAILTQDGSLGRLVQWASG
jgi:flagellar basal body rod protein FlgG